jgi:hypothetical protein
MTLFHCEQARQIAEALALALQERNALQARLEALGGRICPFCDAVTLNLDSHTNWHEKINRDLIGISQEARRYKPPPVYGGS